MDTAIVLIIIIFGIYFLNRSQKYRIDKDINKLNRENNCSDIPVSSLDGSCSFPASPTPHKIIFRTINEQIDEEDNSSESEDISINRLNFRQMPDDKESLSDPLKDVNDALTGMKLDLSLRIYQCQNCKVCYQEGSLEVLKKENNGRCVSCLNNDLALLNAHNLKFNWESSNFNIKYNDSGELINLVNYRNFAGRVITYSGYVPRINVSRDGRSFAVMFEDKSWNQGLKMVVFKGNVRAVGGSAFLKSLLHKNITVRGLLTFHPRFGYEIVVTNRNMIID